MLKGYFEANLDSFKKTGSSDSYFLLAGGGTSAISNFVQVSGANMTGPLAISLGAVEYDALTVTTSGTGRGIVVSTASTLPLSVNSDYADGASKLASFKWNNTETSSISANVNRLSQP